MRGIVCDKRHTLLLLPLVHTIPLIHCIHQEWSDGGLTHCCYCLLSINSSHSLLYRTDLRGIVCDKRQQQQCVRPSHSLLYIRTDLMAVLHTAATASCLTPIQQDWSDGGLTHCCCCLVTYNSSQDSCMWQEAAAVCKTCHQISPMYRSDLRGIVLHTAASCLCTYNSSHSLLYIGLIWWELYVTRGSSLLCKTIPSDQSYT